MKIQSLLPPLACPVLFAVCCAVLPADRARADDKTVEVKLGELTMNVPASWKQQQPKSNLRLGQFEIPAAEGDEEVGELAIFNFGSGGGVDANVRRWIGQFQEKDRQVKLTKGEARQGQYVFVELSGTYNKPDGPPILRKTKPAPDYRMLGVILAMEKKGVYFLKMTGQDKTVAAAAAGLRSAIQADAKKEKPFELDN